MPTPDERDQAKVEREQQRALNEAERATRKQEREAERARRKAAGEPDLPPDPDEEASTGSTQPAAT